MFENNGEESNNCQPKPFLIFNEFKSLIHTTADYRYFVYYGGRGGGKSENVAACLILISTMAVHRILCVREIQSSISESVKSLLEGKIEQMGLQHLFTSTRDEIRCINGSVFMFKGLRTSNAANIKSIFQVTFSWVEEAEVISKESLNLLLPSVLREPHSRIIFTFNPRYEDDCVYDMFLAKKPPLKSHIVNIDYRHNPFFKKSPLEEQRIHDLEVMPKSEYEHKWEGKLRKLAENSLFNERDIEQARYPDYPAREDFYRIVIAVDPATTHKEHSNEYGIVVVGSCCDGTYWALHNSSAVYTPFTFGLEVDRLYKLWNADSVVVETNQGGDFIKASLLTQNPLLNIEEVRASRDKIHRASPVASMLSLGKIRLYDSEESNIKGLIIQMNKITTQGYIGSKGASPDTLDAFVWGIYKLAGLSEKDTEDTIFNMNYFKKPEGFDFKPNKPDLFVGCSPEESVCIEFIICENKALERRISILNCFVLKTQNLLASLNTEKYNYIYIPEREMFYAGKLLNTSVYDDTYEENLDHLVLKTCEGIRGGKAFFEEMEKHQYKDLNGELLKIALGRFKLEQKKECLFTKTFCFLLDQIQ